MPTFPALVEAFETRARAVLVGYPQLAHRWEDIDKWRGRRLSIPKAEESGFDVSVAAYPNGLYAYAGPWHSPAWDGCAPGESVDAMCEEFLGFLRTLLCEDAALAVDYAGGSPYRMRLHYQTEQGGESSVTGQLFFNYFGKRSQKFFRNRHLPRRYAFGDAK